MKGIGILQGGVWFTTRKVIKKRKRKERNPKTPSCVWLERKGIFPKIRKGKEWKMLKHPDPFIPHLPWVLRYYSHHPQSKHMDYQPLNYRCNHYSTTIFFTTQSPIVQPPYYHLSTANLCSNSTVKTSDWKLWWPNLTIWSHYLHFGYVYLSLSFSVCGCVLFCVAVGLWWEVVMGWCRGYGGCWWWYFNTLKGCEVV